MILRLQSFFAGLLALLVAALLALAPAGANPTSGGYQLFEPVALEHQQHIQLASLGNFDYHAKTASECCIAINNALSNVGQTFGVVFLVMLVFLGFRAAFVIASIVPFTIMFALIGMNYIGVDIQQISIAAVIISLGLLVDNGLVVVEDVENRVNAGVSPYEAAMQAGGQFFIPLAVASVTTVSAFIPMMILDGVSGEFAFSLAAVVALMLLGSWLTAHYVLPYLCAIILRPKKKASEGESLLVRGYGVLVRRSLRWGVVIVALCYGAVYVSAGVFGNLKSEMFPLSERSEYLIYLDMPKGTSISATEREALAVEAWLRDPEANPDTANTSVFVGDGGPRFYLALNPADTDPASAFILVNTNSFDGAFEGAARARRYLTEKPPRRAGTGHPPVNGRGRKRHR